MKDKFEKKKISQKEEQETEMKKNGETTCKLKDWYGISNIHIIEFKSEWAEETEI